MHHIHIVVCVYSLRRIYLCIFFNLLQSHYTRPPPVSPSFPPASSGSIPDLTPHPSQMGQPRPTFQGGLPLYQPGGNLGSWGSAPPPPTGNGSGLAMPMYWQGFYGPASGLPPMQQPSLFRPPPGLSLPHSMQHSGINPSLPNVPSNLVPSNLPPSRLPSSSNPVSNVPEMPLSLVAPVSSSSLSLTSSSMTPTYPSNLVNAHSAVSASDTLPVLMPNRAPTTAVHTAALSSSSLLVSPLTTSTSDANATVSPISSKPAVASGPSMGHQTLPQSMSSIVGTPSSSHKEPSVPSLVTPGQLLQPSSAAALSSSHSSPPTHKDVKEVQAPLLSERSATPPKELQAPLLPLPSSSGQKVRPVIATLIVDFVLALMGIYSLVSGGNCCMPRDFITWSPCSFTRLCFLTMLLLLSCKIFLYHVDCNMN